MIPTLLSLGRRIQSGEFLANVGSRGNWFIIPANAGWTETVVNTGVTWQTPFYLRVATGVNVNSEGTLIARASFLSVAGVPYYYINWNRKLIMIFNINRLSSDTQCIGRVQLKQANAEGALGAKGIGLRMSNLALWGESYGTGLATVDLSVTLTSNWDKQIIIAHYPGEKIEWWVDGVLKGTQTTAANIPSGIGTAVGRLVVSIVNGAAGGVDVQQDLGGLKIWQER